MEITITIPGELPALNEIINMSKSHWGEYRDEKFIHDKTVAACCPPTVRGIIKKPVAISFKWYCKDRRKDPDNIAAGQKFIIDGLVAAGVLQGDGWKYIKALRHDFRIDKANPRVEVTLREVDGSHGKQKRK